MKDHEQQPEPQPAGDRPPPRPPKRTAVALGPDDDPESRGPGTITKVAVGEGKFIRQTGSYSQYGHVVLSVAPNMRSRGIEIVNEVPVEVLPAGYAASAIEGIRSSLEHLKMVDVVVRMTGGSFHIVDSSDIAFKMAGIFATQDAIKRAEPIERKEDAQPGATDNPDDAQRLREDH